MKLQQTVLLIFKHQLHLFLNTSFYLFKTIPVSLSSANASSLLVWKGTSLCVEGKVRVQSSREGLGGGGLNGLKATFYSFMQLIKNNNKKKKSTAKHPARENREHYV